MSDAVTIYSARSHERVTYMSALKTLAGQIRRHRWHISQLFLRDFSNSYQLTRFGVVWNYILPIVPITVWVLLAGLRMFPTFEGVSSVVHVTMGVTLWFLFSGFLMTPITRIESKIQEGTRSELPLVGFVISGFAQLIFDTMVRVGATAAVFVFFQGLPSPGLLLAPFVVLFAFFFFTGLGIILGVFNLAYRDIQKIVAMTLSYGMLLSGIVFPIDSVPILSDYIWLNPFYIFVDAIRSLAVHGTVAHAHALIAFSIAGVLIFIFACRFFVASEKRLKGFA